MNNQKRKRNRAECFFLALVMLTICIVPAAAGGLANSTIAIGLKNLITDVSNWLIVLCPLTGIMAGAYFFMRRSMSDEQDGKLWEKRIKIAIGCGVGGGLVSVLISTLSSYF
ncbi:hypothetical protein [Oscillibacter ruminantium]